MKLGGKRYSLQDFYKTVDLSQDLLRDNSNYQQLMVSPIDGELYLLPKTEGRCSTAVEITAMGVLSAVSQ